MNALPRDPAILLSWVNTQLRDRYPSLAELCAAVGAELRVAGGFGAAYGADLLVALFANLLLDDL